jgi:hypothetical protein
VTVSQRTVEAAEPIAAAATELGELSSFQLVALHAAAVEIKAPQQ